MSINEEKATTNKHALRALVAGYYDVQHIRIITGNRLVAAYKRRMGQEPGEKEGTMDEIDTETLTELRGEFKRLADGFIDKRKKGWVLKRDAADNTYLTETELSLVGSYEEQIEREKQEERRITSFVKEERIYAEFLEDIPGCGPVMAGVMIAFLDPHKARHISSFWRYCGLDVVDVDGQPEGRRMKKSHMHETEYVDADGELKTKMTLGYNPWLKSKVLFVLGDCLMRANDDYKVIYNKYKHRLQNRPDLADASKGRIHMMAKRYMVKQLLADLWLTWREMEDLPITRPYHEAKLGMAPHGGEPEHHDKREPNRPKM